MGTYTLTVGAVDKYGLVVVQNLDGSINRQFKITGEDLRALQSSKNGVPPGVTREEWESGRAVVYGQGLDVGDMQVTQDGELWIKYDERQVGKNITQSFLFCKKGEWTGLPPNVTIFSPVSSGRTTITVSDGVLVTK